MVLEVTPLPKPRMTRSDRWKKRKVVINYFEYGDRLRASLPAGYVLPSRIDVTFHLPMPASWSQKKKNLMRGKPHTQRSDVDNLIKGLFDHLAKEDSYIWHIEAKKVWSDEGSIELYNKTPPMF